MQAVDAFDPAGSGLYVPAAQLVHELDPGSLANVPAGHAAQVLEVVAATAELNLPAAQPMHAAEAFVPAFGLYVPAGQSWQWTEAPEAAATVNPPPATRSMQSAFMPV